MLDRVCKVGNKRRPHYWKKHNKGFICRRCGVFSPDKKMMFPTIFSV